MFQLYTIDSYHERWRDWPFETSATSRWRHGAKSSKQFIAWKIRRRKKSSS